MKVQIAPALVTIVFSASAALAAASFPANTLSCEGFAKKSDGNWAMRPGIRTFDIGDAKGITASNIIIPPGLMVIQGVDVWELLNNKCGQEPARSGRLTSNESVIVANALDSKSRFVD